jgi:hypothetical protein
MGGLVKLLDNWKSAYKWFSVQLAALAAAGQLVLATMPNIKDWLSDTTAHYIGAGLIFCIIFGRLLDQSKSAGG